LALASSDFEQGVGRIAPVIAGQLAALGACERHGYR